MMSKVDQMESRPAMPTRSQRALTHPHSDDDACTENNRRHHRRHRRRRSNKGSPDDNLNSCTRGSDANSDTEPWDRAPTAMNPPEIKPVKGPLPPSWSGSKLLAVRADGDAGLGEDENDHTLALAFSAPSAASHGAWGSTIMVLSDVEFENDERRRRAGAVDDLQGAAEGHGDRDEVSSSFSSLVLENDSWATLPGESNDEYPPWTTPANITSEVPVQTRGEREQHACFSVETEAAVAGRVYERRKGKDATSDLADPVVAVTKRRQKKSNICVGVCDEPQQLGFGLDLPKPQPELYDIWIPQQHFQGKALTPSFRHSTKKTAVVAAPSRVRKGGAGVPTPDVTTSPAKTSPIQSCVQVPPTLEINSQGPLLEGVNCLADGKLELKLPHRDAQYAALVEYAPWLEAQGYGEGSQSDSGGGSVGEGRYGYIDYAKRFSWRTATQAAVTRAESEELYKFEVRRNNGGGGSLMRASSE